jgi:hypothetical protein
MDQPESQQEEPEEQAGATAEVWERLDQITRARVIELFAHSAYNFVSEVGRQKRTPCPAFTPLLAAA